MTLKKCSFKYPETDRYILKEVDATVTLGSRAVIVGGNGSGQSTLLVVGTCPGHVQDTSATCPRRVP